MMTLHTNKKDFKDIITIASQNSDISPDILEKDYYVTLMLEELSQKQQEINAYFKGGTCLYKIYAPMQRFSEDIDITLNTNNLTNSQAKAQLKSISKKYKALDIDKYNINNENKKGSITQIYNYNSEFEVPEDSLQRFENVKIEATSFTISEPYEINNISSLLINALPDDIKNNVIKEYGLESFFIKNITLERIFCDKLLAAEFYAERDKFFDVAKHIYDISNMLKMPRILELLKDEAKFLNILSYKRVEETKRIGSDLWNKPLDILMVYDYIKSDTFANWYNKMQNKYVFDTKYRIEIEKIYNDIDLLEEILEIYSSHEQNMLYSNAFIDMINKYNPDFFASEEIDLINKNVNYVDYNSEDCINNGITDETEDNNIDGVEPGDDGGR